jgi:hypothetical protein
MACNGTLKNQLCKYSTRRDSLPNRRCSEWYAQEVIPHTPDAIKVSQYMSNFFVQEGTHLICAKLN